MALLPCGGFCVQGLIDQIQQIFDVTVHEGVLHTVESEIWGTPAGMEDYRKAAPLPVAYKYSSAD